MSENNIIQFAIAVEGGLGPKVWNLYDVDSGFEAVEFSEKNLEAGHIYKGGNITAKGNYSAGIGGGTSGYCSNITILNTVTAVTATKGEDGYCSIGLGDDDDGAINGTVTIGGEDKGNGVTDSPFIYPNN